MFKKIFLSFTVMVTALSQSAVALIVTPINPDGSVSYISDLQVPSELEVGASVDISFTIDASATVYAAVTNTSTSHVDHVFSNYADFQPGRYGYTWFGTSDNTPNGTSLAKGEYLVSFIAYNSSREIVDVAYEYINLVDAGTTVTAPHVSSLAVSPTTFDPDLTTTISFTTDEDAQLTVAIKDGTTVVREFTGYKGSTTHLAGNFSIVWNGENNNGVDVADGTYTVEVKASNSAGTDTKTTTVIVDDQVTPPTDNGIITNVELDPSDNWNPVDEDLEITFELTEDSDNLTVDAREVDTGKVIEIYEDDNVDSGDQDVTFDGTETNGNYINEGEWEIIITADGSRVVAGITVTYDDPSISEAFVTKDEFDIELDEFTYLVFKVDEDAIATVEVYEGNSKKDTLMDEEDVDKNDWIVVKFDGTDDDDDELDEGDYTFKITVEGEGEGTKDIEEVDFEIREDDVSSDKPNATNDYTEPVVFDDREDDSMDINFCIDEDAEIDLTIYKGKSSSGKAEAEIIDGVDYKRGCYTIVWDGKDEDGKVLKNNIYSWKLIAKDGSKKDTETGRFVVGDLNANDDNEKPKPTLSGDCGGYWDTQNVSAELCEALDWLKDEGIMTGNPDGSFRPYDAINRAEVLRITFEAYRDYVTILPSNGSNFGFWDVDPSAWYAPYVRTGKFYGMLHGYLNSTEARPSNTINRAELLKFVLEAADAFTDWEKPGFEVSYFVDVEANNALHDWFFDYAGVSNQYGLFDGGQYLHPASLANRGEAALVLYRLHKAGLIK